MAGIGRDADLIHSGHRGHGTNAEIRCGNARCRCDRCRRRIAVDHGDDHALHHHRSICGQPLRQLNGVCERRRRFHRAQRAIGLGNARIDLQRNELRQRNRCENAQDRNHHDQFD